MRMYLAKLNTVKCALRIGMAKMRNKSSSEVCPQNLGKEQDIRLMLAISGSMFFPDTFDYWESVSNVDISGAQNVLIFVIVADVGRRKVSLLPGLYFTTISCT